MTEQVVEAAEAPAALYGHCQNVYQAMLADAKTVVTPDGETIVAWEGMLTHFITQKMNLSVPYYTSVTNALKRMGCIKQQRRGGGTAPSQWELIQEPTEVLFNTTRGMKQKPQDRWNRMQAQLNDQNRRITILEEALQNIIVDEEASSE